MVTEAAVDAALREERLRRYLHGLAGSMLGSTAMAAVVGVTVWPVVAGSALLAWLAAVGLAITWRLAVGMAQRRDSRAVARAGATAGATAVVRAGATAGGPTEPRVRERRREPPPAHHGDAGRACDGAAHVPGGRDHDPGDADREHRGVYWRCSSDP